MSRFSWRWSIALVMAMFLTRLARAEQPVRDVSARAQAIGTDKPQDEPARLIVTNPDRTRLKFSAFVLGIEKASCQVIGCPPDRGLDPSRASKPLREQIRRTFHEKPLASDCLFVSHIAEFVPTINSAVFAPVLRYDAYRDDDPPAPRDVFMSGRQATLSLHGRLKEFASERAATGRPVSHVIVFTTGWHTAQMKTLANMDELFTSITAAAAGDAAFSPLLIGVSWPSFSDEISDKVQNGAGALTKFGRRQIGSTKELGKLTRFLNDAGIADKVGFLGYPAISKDADEIGLVSVSTLVNDVLMPLRESLPTKPRVVLIGHSFGARIVSWTPFTLSRSPGAGSTVASAGADLVIGLQGAFPAARFDTTIKHRRPYVEGASFADHAQIPTIFAFTCANDEMLRYARALDVMIGDFQAFQRARTTKSPAFSTSKVSDFEDVGQPFDLSARSALLIDARTIISSHKDVRNEKVGRLVWALMKNLSKP